MEHQYKVEPEEDARSEGTQGSQEAARGKLAALDIDLEDKGGKKHVVYHTESPKQSRAYWVANLAGISKKISKQTALEGLIPGAKKISILFASLKLKKLDSNWTSSSRLLSGESRTGPKILSERRAVLGTPSSRYFNGVSCFPALRGLQRSGCN